MLNLKMGDRGEEGSGWNETLGGKQERHEE